MKMISIIIPVKNDKKIERTIKILKSIPKPEKIEIVVVDASGGNLDFIKKKFPTVKWVNFINKTKKKYTFTEQINLGLKSASGDLIAFIDADCIPHKKWLIELARPIRKEGEDYVTGLVKPLEENSIHEGVWKKIDKKIYRDETGSANSLFRKKIIKEVGYFDESFEAGSDVDFSWRVINKGYKIRYNPKAIIFDHWGNLRQEIKRAGKYSEARVKLYRKHPDRLNNLTKDNKDLFTLYAPLFFIYVILIPPMAFIWPYYLLGIVIPIIKNRKVNISRKFLFDFFYGLGILKELAFPKQ